MFYSFRGNYRAGCNTLSRRKLSIDRYLGQIICGKRSDFWIVEKMQICVEMVWSACLMLMKGYLEKDRFLVRLFFLFSRDFIKRNE